MEKDRIRKASRLVAAAVVAAVLVTGLAVLLTGCGTTQSTPAADNKPVTNIAAAASNAPAVEQGATGEPGQAATVEPATVPEPANALEPASPAAVAPAADASLTQESGNVDCPFYDDGICTRTGEPCTNCRE